MNRWIKYSLCFVAVGVIAVSAMARVKMPTESDKKEAVGGKWAKSEKLNPGSVEKDGIIYTRYKKGFASCRADGGQKSNLIQLTILPRIQIEGEACVVDRIEAEGFIKCSKLKHVSIPATVKHVGALAFANNGKLESVACLSNRVEFEMGNLRWFKGGPFIGCKKISTVKWATEQIPLFAYEAFNGNDDCPYSKLLESRAAEISSSYQSGNRIPSSPAYTGEIPSFKEYAEERVTNAYNKWQRKKEYESRGQYADRTSAEKREQMKRELFENARNEYINTYAPENITGTLSDYDPDYKVYTINVQGVGDIYAQVPLADRSFFEDNWTGVEIKPTYNIINNELKVVACTYNIGDRSFVAPQIYDDRFDDFSTMDFEARQIDLDELMADETPKTAGGKETRAASSPVNTAPTTGIHNPDTYALIIGNENYKYVEPVGFALDDAVTFARYCRNTLGLPSQNIMAIQDVTKGELRRSVRELQGIFEDNGAGKSLIVYYAGHGIPDAKNADSLILPVDASASDVESCYSLQELYNQLGELGAGSVVVYMDACFTGSARGGHKLLADRAGVDFVRSQVEPRGNMVVLSATSANETAQPYNKAGHGIFTYFLLEKLQSSKGNLTLGELSDYVTTKVKSQSLKLAGKKQQPSTIVSGTFSGDWRSMPVNLISRSR